MRAQIRKLRRHALGNACSLAEGGLATLGVARPQALLLLGHMRCGSTLLLHLLMTNPQVSAQGERNAVYASGADFARLALSTRLAHPSPLRRLRYVADQVNHNHATPGEQVLGRRRVRAVFLLRGSDAALASLLELSRVFYEGAWSPERALEYYIGRGARLQQLAGGFRPGQAAFLTSHTLTPPPAGAPRAAGRGAGVVAGVPGARAGFLAAVLHLRFHRRARRPRAAHRQRARAASRTARSPERGGRAAVGARAR